MSDANGAARAKVSNPPLQKASFRWASLLCVPLLLSLSSPLQAQFPAVTSATTQITGTVTDTTGAAIPKANVIDDATGKLLGRTDANGQLTLECAELCKVRVEAQGFFPLAAEWRALQPIRLVVGTGGGVSVAPESLPVTRPTLSDTIARNQEPATPSVPASTVPPAHETVTVTAYRTPLGELESPASTRTLTTTDLQQAAAITLDGQLRLIPGAETFRRSSSLVANPSSQGISLRGLGSTSASRTLVTEDDVPLNDAFAGWIHWEELPELSIRSVEVVRGGASDLYGSSPSAASSMSCPSAPQSNFARAQIRLRLGRHLRHQPPRSTAATAPGERWPPAASSAPTASFITTPSQRGLIDVPSNVHAQNGLVLLDHQQGALRIFLRGSAMNEARNNGTPVQINGTRLWRFATGSDWKPGQRFL